MGIWTSSSQSPGPNPNTAKLSRFFARYWISNSNGTAPSIRRLQALHWLAINLRYQNRHTERRHPSEGDRHFRKGTRQGTLRYPADYNELAITLAQQGKHAEAEPLYRHCLGINRKVFGEKHPYTATYLINLGRNLEAQDSLRTPRSCFVKPWQSGSRSGGKNIPIPRRVMGYWRTSSLRRVKMPRPRCCSQGPGVTREGLGEEHPNTAGRYMSLARILNRQGKHAEAALVGERAWTSTAGCWVRYTAPRPSRTAAWR